MRHKNTRVCFHRQKGFQVKGVEGRRGNPSHRCGLVAALIGWWHLAGVCRMTPHRHHHLWVISHQWSLLPKPGLYDCVEKWGPGVNYSVEFTEGEPRNTRGRHCLFQFRTESSSRGLIVGYGSWEPVSIRGVRKQRRSGHDENPPERPKPRLLYIKMSPVAFSSSDKGLKDRLLWWWA